MKHPGTLTLSLSLLAAVLVVTGGSSADDDVANGLDPANGNDVGNGDDAAAEDGVRVENGILMNFRDAPLETVLDHLSEAAGLVVVKTVEVEGRVTVISRQPLTTDEAIMVLNSALYDHGYAAIRAGRTLRIVPQDAARRANIPVRVGNRYDEIAETDEVITQVIPVRHAAAGDLVDDLSGIMSETADVASNASSNTIIMTDASVNIRRFVQILAAVDTAISSVATVQIFQLQFANATEAARLINEVFQQEQQTGEQDPRRAFQQMFGGRGGRGGPGGRGGDGDEEGSRVQTRIFAAADERTNTVVVTGPEETLLVVADVLEQLDENPMASQGVFTYKVQHGQAVNLQSVLETLFSGTDSDEQGGGRGGRGGFRQAMEQLATEAQQASADLRGQVQIVADEDSNSLLVMTAPNNFDAVREVLADLDQPVPQVVIKALVAEVTHTDDLDLGAEFSILNIPRGSTLFTDFGVEAATGGITYRLLETDIEATIRALQQVGQLEVLSRPYILASDNQAAEIIIGSRIPIPTSQTFGDLGVGSRTNFSYEDIGIILRVTPHINPEGRVTMDVFPEISSLSPDRIEISEGFFPPVINQRSAETRVAINDGQTIVIGGLMEDQVSETVRKVPLLGDIPLLGLAFQRRETEKSKTELLIFLTPHIATDGERLQEISDHERGSTRIIPGAIEDGAFERYLDNLDRWDPNRVDLFEDADEPEAEPQLFENENRPDEPRP